MWPPESGGPFPAVRVPSFVLLNYSVWTPYRALGSGSKMWLSLEDVFPRCFPPSEIAALIGGRGHEAAQEGTARGSEK